MTKFLVNLTEKIHACSATNSVVMIEYYQEYLKQLLNADQVIWHAAYKGNFGRVLWHTRKSHGWKIVDTKLPIEGTVNLIKVIKSYYKQSKASGDVDPQLRLAVDSAGKTRVHLLKDAIRQEQWEKHWMKALLDKFHIGERMVGIYSLSERAESYFLVDRKIGAKPFTGKERAIFLEALKSFPRMHYWLFLERGLVKPATKPLSPRDKEVIHYLLGSYSEQEIANAMSLTKGTVHNYIVNIYKTFGVNSRYALAQLWLKTVPSHDLFT